VGIAGIALVLPYSPLAARLGFVPLPAGFLLFLAISVPVYLFLVELVKGPFVRSKLLGPR
jgi:P-type Mg2+ transporter